MIRLEQDPLEVLKMGTYVGSCLGLGGGLTYSAAAALLDVNKQVLYARDEQGTVIARQLVAISDDNQLVPFRSIRVRAALVAARIRSLRYGAGFRARNLARGPDRVLRHRERAVA